MPVEAPRAETILSTFSVDINNGVGADELATVERVLCGVYDG